MPIKCVQLDLWYPYNFTYRECYVIEVARPLFKSQRVLLETKELLRLAITNYLLVPGREFLELVLFVSSL